MENFYENLKKHFESTPVEVLKKQWEEVKDKEAVGILIDDLYQQIKTMKNIYKIGKELFITSEEMIKVGDFFIHSSHGISNVYKAKSVALESIITACDNGVWIQYCKKIILTTDKTLIAERVQAIDDDFLNWFVNNQNCEYVKVTKLDYLTNRQYRIYDLPQSEPERGITITNISTQETINLVPVNEFGSEITVNGYGFDKFVKKQQEANKEVIVYSEEEVLELLYKHTEYLLSGSKSTLEEWFNNNKKK